MKVLSKENCQMNYTKTKDTITASMMCATGHSATGGITDTCQGDSGGGSCGGLFTRCCVKLRVFVGEDLVKITKILMNRTFIQVLDDYLTTFLKQLHIWMMPLNPC